MIYLLDTNAVIALLNGRPPAVRQALTRARAAGHEIGLSAIVLHELWYGVAKGKRRADNAEALRKLSLEGFSAAPFDEQDAEIAGCLRGELADAGAPIGPYDVLIAAQALKRDAILITANEREFARVPRLRWENWAA